MRRVETLEELLQALEIDWRSSGSPRTSASSAAREAARGVAELQADGTLTTYLAYIDDEPVGFGRDVFTPHGGLHARRRDAPRGARPGRLHRRSCTRAGSVRASSAAAPRLVVSAGPQSAPILEQPRLRARSARCGSCGRR